MKTRQKLYVAAAALLAVSMVGAGGFASIKAAAEAPTVTDECSQIGGEGAVTADIYGMALQSGDVGFGADGRYTTAKAPSAAPTAETLWDAEYAYAQYTVSGQNLVTVTADVVPSAAGILAPVMCYAQNGGGALEVNNTIKTTSSNWTRISYTYILGEGTEWIRIIPTAYNAEDKSVATWMQQITKVEIKYVSELPPKDEEKAAPVYTDICNGNLIEGQRADVYNIKVNGDKSGEIGDGDRILFGENPGALESYIEYNLKGQDTVAVTAYEEVLENNQRPANATAVKFSLFDGATCKVWEAEATKVDVELGDYTAKRWTKLTFYYILDDVSDGKVRVHIYKPAEGQSEIQLGRVDIYDSHTAELTKLHAKQDVERYSFLKGQANYSTDKWNALQDIMTAALVSIDEAEASAVEGIVTKAKADMDAVLTSAQEFEAKKTDKKQEIADYAASKKESEYTAENWELIQDIVKDACKKIDEATGETQINNAVLDAKSAIDEVAKKPADSSGADSGNSEKSEAEKGCGSSVSALGLLGIGLLGLAVAGKKRR